jgi:DNA mismatch repair protein MSH3
MIHSILQARIDAVEEIISSPSENLVWLREALKNLPDLAKGLCRIQYGKVIILRTFVLLSQLRPQVHSSGIGYSAPCF